VKIDHIAIWTVELERLRTFYEKYFWAKSGAKYKNNKKNFESYFLEFDDNCRLEIMQMTGIPLTSNDIYKQFTGLIHVAISVGSKQHVDSLTETLRKDGY
jgi:lactoylglutathione lyase